MSKQAITTINGVEIFAETTEDGSVFVPVKPICTAIGIDPEAQRQRIERHYILRSVAFTLKATGADGKQYEMLCLPLEYVYGWLFTIDANLVAESARERVADYQQKCYDALYRHFTGALARQVEANEEEIAALNEVNAALAAKKQAEADVKAAQRRLEAIRAERLNLQPSLF